MTDQMLNLLVQAAVLIIGLAVAAGAVKQSLNGLTNGQEAMQDALRRLTETVAALATASAVNTAQHEDLSRQIAEINKTLGRHAERISKLRTATHLHANKIMELDPGWRPYRDDDSPLELG